MSTSRTDIEVRKAHAIITKQRLEKSNMERMTLKVSDLIAFCKDTIVICNSILSWPQCPNKGLFGRDWNQFDICDESTCEIDVMCRNVHKLMNMDEDKSNKRKPYTPKCFGKIDRSTSCEVCPFSRECKENKNDTSNR